MLYMARSQKWTKEVKKQSYQRRYIFVGWLFDSSFNDNRTYYYLILSSIYSSDFSTLTRFKYYIRVYSECQFSITSRVLSRGENRDFRYQLFTTSSKLETHNNNDNSTNQLVRIMITIPKPYR